ncbi:hypothetical protein [Rhizohabitans arisaemae]|uniref:hypothetical protein n=1 Tax=Rhizohabitans arisaemae TaxID=2720610 RepID=UPI0024B093C6|nr:hypothetical protein [Rhizohabitans arisaemae]
MKPSALLIPLIAAGVVAVTAVPANAEVNSFRVTVNPGEEIFASGPLKKTKDSLGAVLVKLEENAANAEVKVGNCKGKYLGAAAIVANDHRPAVAAAQIPTGQCVRLKVKNNGTAPTVFAGTWSF